MLYVGIDFHKNYSFITEMDEAGDVKRQAKIANDRTTLTNYINKLPGQSKLAIEATCNWYYFYVLVEDHDLDIFLAHLRVNCAPTPAVMFHILLLIYIFTSAEITLMCVYNIIKAGDFVSGRQIEN